MPILSYNKPTMQCPIDQTTLTIADRQGIEIDYCPTCRGVWLDRGELDKLIERSNSFSQQAAPRHEERNHEPRREERRDYDEDNYNHGGHNKHHKKESFIGDLFDF